jgi:cell wall-associated NlpC family hydrolase
LITQTGYVARPGVGYEIVARLLRLRTNLDQTDDAKEHAWYEQASRGDAIWSAAQMLKWGGWEKQDAIDTVELLALLPATSGPQHDAIQRAFDFIGMPYIWGGTSEKPQILFGRNTAGGFDCSGFVWRVMALDATSPVGVAKALGGRTTFEMAAKTPAPQRLTAELIAPTDVLLFGTGGVNAASSSIGHTGMAISGQLFIQSSGQGIALARWDKGYYKDRLAFGKRVL